jgi:hypothetical protein
MRSKIRSTVDCLGPSVLSVLLTVGSSIQITSGGGRLWFFVMVIFGCQSIRQIRDLPTTP